MGVFNKQVNLLLNRYDAEINMVFDDLVEGALLIADENDDVELLAAVRKYRAEERENYEVWGMRDGMEQAEEDFMSVLHKISGNSKD